MSETGNASKAILFSPHSDDAELFSAYQCLKHKPLVVVCFESHQQHQRHGITHKQRVQETSAAMDVLECQWDQLPISDHTDDFSVAHNRGLLLGCMEELRDSNRWNIVIAPAWEHNGHEGHNLVADCATQVFNTTIRYMTYSRGNGRSRSSREVAAKPGWATKKLRAMACHQSQIELGDTRPWFGGEWWREWVA